MHDSDADGSVGKSANEIGCSINRVNYPPESGLKYLLEFPRLYLEFGLRYIISKNNCFAIRSTLFANKFMIRILLSNFFQYRLFYELVSRSDKINLTDFRDNIVIALFKIKIQANSIKVFNNRKTRKAIFKPTL